MSQIWVGSSGGGGGGGIETLTGDNAIVVSPDGSGNVNINGDSNITTNGISASNEIQVTLNQNISITGNYTTTAGNIYLPNTASDGSAGILYMDSQPWLYGRQSFNQNVFVGNSGNFDSSIGDNVAIGLNALFTLTSGATGNIAIGKTSLENLSSGISNICIGVSSGATYTGSENRNICIGYSGILGENNAIHIGPTSTQYNQVTVSGTNTVMGSEVLYGNNGVSGGTYNTLIGYSAGFSYSHTESQNICLGATGTSGESNAIHIGDSYTDSTTTYIGGIQSTVITGTPVIVSLSNQLGVAASSLRFKKDIKDMQSDSEVIYKLRPVSFTWDQHSVPGLKDAPQTTQYGLIAEEAIDYVPHAVTLDKEGNPLSISYDKLVAMLINEIQKLSKRIETLESL